MRAGLLRHRITIEALDPTPDGYGDTAPDETDGLVWEPLITRWAAVEPLVGREYYKAQAEGSKATHWVRMRKVTVSPKNRLRWGSRILNILSVQEVEGRNRETRLLCEEVLT